MAAPASDDSEEKPLDPAVERVRQKLLRFVVINLGLLFTAVIIVIGAIVYRSATREAPPAAVSDVTVPSGETIEADIPVPAGARIVSQALDAGRVSLQLELPDAGREILIYDFRERRVVARLRVQPQ